MSAVDDFLNANSTAARVRTAGFADSDPEQAARAIELSDSSGVPAPAIYGDVEGFERQHKTQMASDIIGDNHHIANFINSDPLAAPLSHDDLGTLDEASHAISSLVGRGPLKAAQKYLTGGFAEAAEGFKEGFGTQPVGSWMGPEYWLKYPASAGVMNAMTGVPEIGLRAVSGVVRGLAELVRTRVKEGADAAGLNGDLLSRDLAGMLEAEAMGMTGRHGLPSPEQVQVIRGAVDAAKPYLEAGKMPPTGVHPWLDSVYKAAATEDATALDAAVRQSAKSVTRDRSPEHYANFAEGPAGDAKIKIDASAIARLYGDSRPELDDNLLGWVPNLSERLDATVGSGGYIDVPLKDYLAHIDPDVHKELRDDILIRDHGFTVNEAKELEEPPKPPPTITSAAIKYGDKQYEGRIHPDAVKKLAEDLGVDVSTDEKFSEFYTKEYENIREGFITSEGEYVGRKRAADIAQAAEQYKEPRRGQSTLDALEVNMPQDSLRTLPGHTQVLRGSAGLEPLMAVGDRKLYLERKPQKPLKESPYADAPIHMEGEVYGADQHNIYNENGEVVGWLDATPTNGGKRVYIDNIGGLSDKGYGPNGFGPALIRELRNELKRQYPNMEEIGGYRVTGAREKAGSVREVWIKAALDDPEMHKAFRDLLTTMHEVHETGARAAVVPGELWTKHENEIADAVHEELERIAPGAARFVTKKLDYAAKQTTGQSVKGLFLPKDMAILVSVDNPGAVGFAAHEGIHYLREAGLFTDEEWAGLEATAKKEGWQEKFGIDRRYAKYGDDIKLEESIAEAYRDWAHGSEYSAEAHGVFEKLKQFFERIKERLRAITGKPDFDWKDLFQQVEMGEIGQREFEFGRDAKEPRAAIEEEGPEPIQVKLPFAKGKAIGITQKTYDNYMKLIQQRHEADLKADFDKIYDKERRTQTKEWKENAKAIRDQVESELDEKPNVLIDRLLSERGGNLKIDPMSLRKDLRDALPKEYLRRTNSMSADDLAGYFGYPSGDAMAEHLAELTKDRQESGLSHGDYVKKLTDDEVQRRMEAQFGFLEKNVLEEAKDRALSQNQIDILHEETAALSMQAGIKIPIERSALERDRRDKFLAIPSGSVSSDSFLRDAGKAGRLAEKALLDDDYQTAFKEKQAQFFATLDAKWAHEHEKAQKQLDKVAKSLGKMEPGRGEKVPVEPTYLVHAQDLLRRVGYKTKRSLENIRENIARQSATTLQEFVSEKLRESDGYNDIPLAEFLWNPGFSKALDELTVQEFNDVKATIDGLNKAGRAEQKVYYEGEAADLAEVRKQMIAQIKEFPKQDIKPGRAGEPSKMRRFGAALQSMETIWQRLDLHDKNGVFHKYILYPFARAANEETRMQRETEIPYRALSKPTDLNKLVDSPLDPEIWQNSQFTKENLLGLAQNMGNKSNWDVTARGWGRKPDELWDVMIQHAQQGTLTREDFLRAQAMGKIFNKLINIKDVKNENRYGSTVDKIPLTPIEIDFKDGKPPLQLEGWYHPLISDPRWEGKGGKGDSVYDDVNVRHIATNDGYTQARRGAIYPVDLTFSAVPQLMKQMIHDIAFRDTVLDTQKLLLDPQFKNAMTSNYGQEYTQMLRPYLQAMAGKEGRANQWGQAATQMSEYLRKNSIFFNIAFNLGTVAKHAPTAFFMSAGEVGYGRFLSTYYKMMTTRPDGRPASGNVGANFTAWQKWIKDQSEEIQRRERHWNDTLGVTQEQLYGDLGVRDRMNEYGAWLVAKSDRASADPLWLTRYEMAVADGDSIGLAKDKADLAVRTQHGSTAITNQPEVIRQEGFQHGWLVSVYGFFGTVMQRRIETFQRLNDIYKLGKEKEISEAAAKLPGLFWNVMHYWVIPTMIEEWVTSQTTENKEGWGEYMAKAAARGAATSFPYLRDFVYALSSGHDPSFGLLSAPTQSLQKTFNDTMKGREALNRQHAGKTIQDFLSLVGGYGLGLVPKPVANLARYAIDTMEGVKHQTPKSIGDYYRILQRGTPEKRVEK